MRRPAPAPSKVIETSLLSFRCQSILALDFLLKTNSNLDGSITIISSGTFDGTLQLPGLRGNPICRCSARELGEGVWNHLFRLMKFSCTKPELILLGFE